MEYSLKEKSIEIDEFFSKITHIQVVQISFVLVRMHEKNKDQIKVFSMDARK
jgi:hypothetical protein